MVLKHWLFKKKEFEDRLETQQYNKMFDFEHEFKIEMKQNDNLVSKLTCWVVHLSKHKEN